MFNCSMCPATHLTDRDLYVHQMTDHNTLACPWCGKMYTLFRYLTQHVKKATCHPKKKRNLGYVESH